ncbi:MAG: hypothetical protein PVJ01_01905, partial [Pseudomonadota bacterium]
MKKVIKKKILIYALVLSAMAMLGTGVSITMNSEQRVARAQAPEEEKPAVKAKAVNVGVQVLAPEDVEETFTLPGTLEAWDEITLSLERPGTIVWIGPEEGERLRAGEEILRIDKESLEAQLEKNRTDYDIRKKQLER